MQTINPIRKELVKQSLLKGNTARQALKDAGLSKTTAEHRVRKDNKLLNVARAEILDDIKDRITVEYVLNNLKKLAETSKNKADRIRANELLGKWLAMFTDKYQGKSEVEITETGKSILDKYIHCNRLDKVT